MTLHTPTSKPQGRSPNADLPKRIEMPLADVIGHIGNDPVAQTEGFPLFHDPDVQKVYRVLSDNTPVPNLEEHWEGWVARRIVAALRGGRENNLRKQDVANLFEECFSRYGPDITKVYPPFAEALLTLSTHKALLPTPRYDSEGKFKDLEGPSELDMHRAGHAAVQRECFESVGELLAAYKELKGKYASRKAAVKAMLIGAVESAFDGEPK